MVWLKWRIMLIPLWHAVLCDAVCSFRAGPADGCTGDLFECLDDNIDVNGLIVQSTVECLIVKEISSVTEDIILALLAPVTALRVLRVTDRGSITRVPDLTKFKDTVEKIIITDNAYLKQISFSYLATFTRLRTINLKDSRVEEILPLGIGEKFPALVFLDLTGNSLDQYDNVFPPVVVSHHQVVHIQFDEIWCNTCMMWMVTCSSYNVTGVCSSNKLKGVKKNVSEITLADTDSVQCNYDNSTIFCHTLVEQTKDQGVNIPEEHYFYRTRPGGVRSNSRRIMRCAAACAARQSCLSFDIQNEQCLYLQQRGGLFEKP